MNPVAIVSLLTLIAQAAPEVAGAIGAVSKMVNGVALTPADLQSIGQAAMDAHVRLQALGTTPAVNSGTIVTNPPQPAS